MYLWRKNGCRFSCGSIPFPSLTSIRRLRMMNSPSHFPQRSQRAFWVMYRIYRADHLRHTGLGWYAFLMLTYYEFCLSTWQETLFDIANSLADVMICVPSTNHKDDLGVGPRDPIHSLAASPLQAWQPGYSPYSSRQVDYPRPVRILAARGRGIELRRRWWMERRSK